MARLMHSCVHKRVCAHAHMHITHATLEDFGVIFLYNPEFNKVSS